MKIYPFKALSPNAELITSPESFFDNVKTQFRNYKENGFYEEVDEKAFFIYTISKNGMTHSGIIADTDIEDLVTRRKIRKHEQTLVSKEQTMIHLILHRQAMVKPVLLTFPDVKEISQLINNIIETTKIDKDIVFNSNGETHSFRKISEPKLVKKIQELFESQLNRTYIADGHHRASTMSILYGNQRVPNAKTKFRRLLCAYFPFSELTIESYNRVINLTDTISPTLLMAKLSEYCKITWLESAQKPDEKHSINMYLNKEWYRLKWKKKVFEKYKNQKVVLDSALFNHIVLKRIMGIEDVRFDLRIGYISGTKGTKGVIKAVGEKDNQAGFYLPSVEPEEIVSIVDEGRTLPPKSTWFLPRLRSGIIVKEFET